MNKRNAAALVVLAIMFLSLGGAWARPWSPDEKSGDDSVSVLSQASQNAAENQATASTNSTGKSACPILSRGDLRQKLKVLVLESAAESRGALMLSDQRVSSGVGIWLGGKKAPSGIFNCVFPYKGRRTRQSPAEVSLAKDMSRWVAANPPAVLGAKLPAAWVGNFLNAAQSDSLKIIGKSAFKSKKGGRKTEKENKSTAKNTSSVQSAIDKAKSAQAQTDAQNKAVERAVGQPALKIPSPAVLVKPIQTPILSPILAGWREAGQNKAADVNDLMTNHGWISAVSPLPNGHADPGIMSPNHHEFYDVNTQKVYVFTPASPVRAKNPKKPQPKPVSPRWKEVALNKSVDVNDLMTNHGWFSAMTPFPSSDADPGIMSPNRHEFYDINTKKVYVLESSLTQK